MFRTLTAAALVAVLAVPALAEERSNRKIGFVFRILICSRARRRARMWSCH